MGIIAGAAAAPATPDLGAEFKQVFGRDATADDLSAWGKQFAGGGEVWQDPAMQINGLLAARNALTPTPSPTPAPAASGGGFAPAVATPLGPTTKWDVNAEQTVEDRIRRITDPNNPIIAQARAGALAQANDRGLLNSSIATGAADAAAYQTALPIATADAATYAKAAGYNADQSNQFAVKGAELGTQTSIANLNANTNLATANLSANNSLATAKISADTARATALLNADTSKYTANLSADNQKVVQQMQLDNQKLLQTNQQAAQAFNTAMQALNNIQMSTTMDADTKTKATQNVWDSVKLQLGVLQGVSGLDLTSLLNFGPTAAPAPTTTPGPTPAPTTAPDRTNVP